MSLGRTFRTARHLTAEQWLYRLVCRGRFAAAARAPRLYRASVERTARAFPAPDADSARLRAAAAQVLQLQQAVHGAHLDGFARGRFHFLGRTVDFGGFDRIQWRRDLGEKNNPLWRMNLAYMGWLVCLLARGQPAELQRARLAIESLEAQNGWRQPGVFRDVWHPYAASHRLINLLCGLALYRAAGGAGDAQAEAAILNHAKICAAFVLRNLERDLQYNHLFKNFVALAAFRAALAGPCEQLDFLDGEIARSLRQQILPDGGHAERSPMYHALCLIDLRVLAAAGVATENEAAAALHALGATMHADGDIALFNDSWLGEAPAARALGAAPADGKLLLPRTGYARLGAGGDGIVFDCGPCGPDANPGHAHADFLSVESTVYGRRFLVDPGVPTYSEGPLRDESRSAARHNGPHLAGAEPIEFWGSFRVGRRGHAYPLEDAALGGFAPLWCAGWQDGYRPQGVTVARWVGLWPGEALLLVDVWHGSAGNAALEFLVPATWRHDSPLRFASQDKTVALQVPIGGCAGVAQAQCWPRYGEAEAAHAVAVRPELGHRGAVAATLWRWGGDPGADVTPLARNVAARLQALCMNPPRFVDWGVGRT